MGRPRFRRHSNRKRQERRPVALNIPFAEAYTPLLELPQPGDDQYMTDLAFFGGRGTAKSHHIATACALCASVRQERVVGTRQFQNAIAESSKGLIENKITEMGMRASWKFTDRELVHLGTESKFTFMGLDRNPESIKSLEGATIAWQEEARMVKEIGMEILIPTIRAPGSRRIWSWNPKFRSDPVDAYFRGPEPPLRSLVRHVTHADNPWFHRTELPDQKSMMLRVNKRKHDHIWEGAYDETGDSRIFNNWKVGVVDVPDHARPLFGMDFGFSTDPSTLIKLYVLEAERIVYIAAEAWGKHIGLADLPQFMLQVPECDRYTIRADSARPDTIDFLNNVTTPEGYGYGFSVVGARKGPGSIKTGIEWLQSYTIIIHPSCIHAQDEFETYSWQVDERSQKILPIPVDADNHVPDAVRYAVSDIVLGGVDISIGKRRRKG